MSLLQLQPILNLFRIVVLLVFTCFFYGNGSLRAQCEPVLSIGSGNTNGCAPLDLTVFISGVEQNSQETTYSVDFGDGSATELFNHPPPQSIIHTYLEGSCGATFGISPNSFGVTIIATNTCGQSIATISPIRISEPPAAGFTANPEIICVNQVATLTSTADPGATVTANGCTSNAVMYWSITPATGWSASNLGSDNGLPVNQYSGWSPGASTLPVTFTEPGTYTVSQVIANGCGEDTFTETVCVIPPPTCAFTLTPLSGCSVLSVSSNNTSVPPSCNNVPLALQYNWTVSPPSGGTGSSTISSSTVQNPTFTFTNTGLTNITFTVTLNITPLDPLTGLLLPCSTICTQQVNVFSCSGVVDAGGPYEVCGASPVTLNAFSNSSGQWSGGSGTFSNASSVNSVYTPAVNEIGTIVNLTWTADNPEVGTDQATVNVSTPATFTPLTPLTICSSLAAQLGVISTPAMGSWSGGSGTFSSTTSPNAIYTPGASDVGNLNLNLVWTTADPDGAGPCPPLVVNQPLSVIGTATAEAGGPYTICGSVPITLSGSANGNGQWTGGSGTFSNVTSVNSTYTPASGEVGNSVTLTWTTNDPDGTGPCTSATDQSTLTVSTPASFTPLTPLTICSSSTAQLSVVTTPATGSWSGGSGTFSSASSPNAIYTPGAADITNANLNLVWTTSDPDGNGPCLPITVNQPLDVIGTSTAEAGGPYFICGEAAVTLNAEANGTGQWTGGTGTFADIADVGTSYTPSANEVGNTVNLTWTTNDPDGAGPCSSSTDVAILVVESCSNTVYGCTDLFACNYDSLATDSDNSCIYPAASYLNCDGNCINDIDSDGVCDEAEISGCTNPEACNYDALATDDDGSCVVLFAAEIVGNITPDAFSLENYSYSSSVAGSTLQWTITNGVIISGQGTEAVQVQWAGEGMGVVQVQEIVDADCSGPLVALNVVVMPVQGLMELKQSELTLFPNPALDEVRVKGRLPLTGCTWKLMDLTGRIVEQGVFQSAEGRVWMRNCAMGHYVLQVSSQEEVFEERVIKMDLN